MQKHLKKLISLTLATLLAFTCYVGYQEVSADMPNASANAGHFHVDGDSTGWSHDNSTGVDVITISASGDYTISKDCDCTNDTVHEDYQIVIGGGLTVNLTIEDVQIEYDSGAPMDIDGTSTVTLILEGDNSFISTATGYAGIQFNNADTLGGSLTITSDSEENTLTARGSTASAGIGSDQTGNASNITISGGNVTAIGTTASAGIGSGQRGNASNITISGGNVTAIGGTASAGIGSGQRGDASNITISGGTVTATGYDVGIGAGQRGSASNITISGGSVKASSISITPQNDDGVDVYLVAIPDMSGVNSVTVDGATTYTRDGDHIDYDVASSSSSYDGTFYLYLTGEDHEITVGDNKYKATWDDSSNSFTVEKVEEEETPTTGESVIIVDTSSK